MRRDAFCFGFAEAELQAQRIPGVQARTRAGPQCERQLCCPGMPQKQSLGGGPQADDRVEDQGGSGRDKCGRTRRCCCWRTKARCRFRVLIGVTDGTQAQGPWPETGSGPPKRQASGPSVEKRLTRRKFRSARIVLPQPRWPPKSRRCNAAWQVFVYRIAAIGPSARP